MSKLSRFSYIERPREPAEPTEKPAGSSARFEAPKTPVQPDAERAPAQPFSRCANCQADNGRFASHCQICGSDLRAPEQRAFNEELWKERQQEAALEREQLAQLEAQRRGVIEEDERRNLEYHATMSRTVEAQTRRQPGRKGKKLGQLLGQDDPTGAKNRVVLLIMMLLAGALGAVVSAIRGGRMGLAIAVILASALAVLVATLRSRRGR